MKTLLHLSVLLFISSAIFAAELPSIAVLSIEPKNTDSEIADMISEKLNLELYKSGHYKVVEREKLSQITKEQQLQLSGLTGTEYASQLGEMISAQQLMLGSIYTMENVYHLYIRVLDVQSSQYISAGEIESSTIKELFSKIPGLVVEISGGKTSPNTSGETSDFNIEDSIQFLKKNYFPNLQNFTNRIDIKLEDRIKALTQSIDNQTKTGNIQGNKKETSITNNKPQKTVLPQKKREFPFFDIFVDSRYSFADFNFPAYNLTGNFFYLGGSLLYNINPLFAMGLGGGVGLLFNEFNPQYDLSMGYAGIQMRFRLTLWRISLGASVTGGVGKISVIDNGIFSILDQIVINPTIILLDSAGHLSFMVGPHLDITLSVSYLWSSQFSSGVSLNSLTAGLSLDFRI